jgi:lipoyl(octanoyl) transferase
MHLNFINWGLKAYDEALKEQEEIFNKKVNQKLLAQKDISQDFIVCQHPHVYTLGKHGKISNLLANPQYLEKINATFHKINRGGDITYHGPGQIVGYPSLDIDALGLTLRTYIETIEQSVIDLMEEYSIKCERLKGATGVWIDANTPKARKICAIGVKASRGITMHGFALNINTDLQYFNYINPCGFTDKGVTSLQKELSSPTLLDIEEIQKKLFHHFVKLI